MVLGLESLWTVQILIEVCLNFIGIFQPKRRREDNIKLDLKDTE